MLTRAIATSELAIAPSVALSRRPSSPSRRLVGYRGVRARRRAVWSSYRGVRARHRAVWSRHRSGRARRRGVWSRHRSGRASHRGVSTRHRSGREDGAASGRAIALAARAFVILRAATVVARRAVGVHVERPRIVHDHVGRPRCVHDHDHVHDHVHDHDYVDVHVRRPRPRPRRAGLSVGRSRASTGGKRARRGIVSTRWSATDPRALALVSRFAPSVSLAQARAAAVLELGPSRNSLEPHGAQRRPTRGRGRGRGRRT